MDVPSSHAERKGSERGAGRYTQKRLVEAVTLSLKYPEVFFPRNSTSLSPPEQGWISCEDREVTSSTFNHPSFFLFFSFFLSFHLSFFPSYFPFCSLAKQFIRASTLQTATHYSRTIKLPRALRTCPGLHALGLLSPSSSPPLSLSGHDLCRS